MRNISLSIRKCLIWLWLKHGPDHPLRPIAGHHPSVNCYQTGYESTTDSLIRKSHSIFGATLPWLRTILSLFWLLYVDTYIIHNLTHAVVHLHDSPSLWNATCRSGNNRLLNTYTFSPSSLDFDQLISQAHINRCAQYCDMFLNRDGISTGRCVLSLEGKSHQLLNKRLKEGSQSNFAIHG